MAHIPYGYRITNGQASLCVPEAVQIRLLFQNYLSGMTIPQAGADAGMPLPASSLGNLLKKPVYTGDDYYPRIVEPTLFQRVQEERQRRYRAKGSFGRARPRPIVPIQKEFRMLTLGSLPNDPIDRAEAIYRRIEAIPDFSLSTEEKGE